MQTSTREIYALPYLTADFCAAFFPPWCTLQDAYQQQSQKANVLLQHPESGCPSCQAEAAAEHQFRDGLYQEGEGTYGQVGLCDVSTVIAAIQPTGKQQVGWGSACRSADWHQSRHARSLRSANKGKTKLPISFWEHIAGLSSQDTQRRQRGDFSWTHGAQKAVRNGAEPFLAVGTGPARTQSHKCFVTTAE